MAEKQSENRVDTPSVPTVAELQAEISRLKDRLGTTEGLAELLRARAEAAEALVAEYRAYGGDEAASWVEQKARAEAAEARLSAISALVKTWRERAFAIESIGTDDTGSARRSHGRGLRRCADDLSALVPGASAGGGVPVQDEGNVEMQNPESLPGTTGPKSCGEGAPVAATKQGDRAENTTDNPKSWIAWKRRAEAAEADLKTWRDWAFFAFDCNPAIADAGMRELICRAHDEATLDAGELIEVTRVEVIDHREGIYAGPHPPGRVFIARPCDVTLSIQDDGRTLKVFVDNPRKRRDEAQSGGTTAGCITKATSQDLEFSSSGAVPEWRETAWQPIETAPRNGTKVLVWREGSDVATARHGSIMWLVYGYLNYEPTHWMPLPPAPETRQE
jgi:hypothetical protein